MDAEPGRARFSRAAALRISTALVLSMPAGLHAQSPAPDVAPLLVQALDAMRARFPRSVSIHVRLPGHDVTQTWEVADQRHYRFAQVPPGGALEFVVWDDNAYLRSGAGWYRKQLNTVPINLGDAAWLPDAVAHAVSNGERLPDEQTGGAVVRHYTARLASHDALGPYAGRIDLWLAATSPVPLRSRFVGTYAGQPITMDTRIDYAAAPSFGPPQPLLNPP